MENFYRRDKTDSLLSFCDNAIIIGTRTNYVEKKHKLIGLLATTVAKDFNDSHFNINFPLSIK